jgi:hypothetical protein
VGCRRDRRHGCALGLPIMRRALVLFLAFVSLAPSASGQVSLSGSERAGNLVLGGATTFSCALNAIAATLTQCQGVPASGRYYVTSIHVQTTTTTSGTYAVQTGTGTNCGTGTAALFPSSGTANRFNAPITTSAMASLWFPTPLVVPVGAAICVIGVATNTISIQITGVLGT